MCSRRGSCVVGFASFFTWVAFSAAGVALFAPFWFTMEIQNQQLTKGIVLECREPFSSKNRSCEWTLEDAWEDVKEGDFGDNFLVVQITFIVGTGLLLLNAVLTFLLCCDKCRNRGCSVLLTILVFVAAACLAVSVIIFGIDNKNKFDRDDDKGFYDWGYYVAIGAAAFGVLASLFLGCSICAIRKEV